MSSSHVTSGASAADHAEVPFRRRTDLVAIPRQYGLSRDWILKDPFSRTYFRLTDPAYQVWRLLDRSQGRHLGSWSALLSAARSAIGSAAFTLHDLVSCVEALWQQGLILDDRHNAAPSSRGHARRSRWQTWFAQGSVLALRWRGVDPQPWLDPWLPVARALVRPAAVVLWSLLLLSAMVLTVTQADEVARLWQRDVAMWPLLPLWTWAVVLSVVKLLHELGHAFACRLCGGEVRELGLMLLVFTPTMYCDVSDAWLLPRRRHRLWIGAAGMLVELVLASAALWIWWFTPSGSIHSTAGQVLVMCGISTLVFNANPLLRYDGYFLLADACEQPNLSAAARRATGNWFERWLCAAPSVDSTANAGIAGSVSSNEPALPGSAAEPTAGTMPPEWGLGGHRPSPWLVVYGVSAGLARLALVAAVCVLLLNWFVPAGLAWLAWALIALWLWPVVLSAASAMQDTTPVWRAAMHTGRFRWGRGLLLAAVVVIAVSVPWPRRVVVPAVLEPAEARPVFVTRGGELQHIVPPMTWLEAGDVIAVLRDPQLDVELARLEQAVITAQDHAERLQRQRLTDPTAAWRWPAASAAVSALRAELAAVQAQLAELTIRAPVSGRLWPEASACAPLPGQALPSDTAYRTSPRAFSAAEPQAWLLAGQQLGVVAPSDDWVAVAMADGAWLHDVTADAAGWWLPAATNEPLPARVERVGSITQRAATMTGVAFRDLFARSSPTMADGSLSAQPAGVWAFAGSAGSDMTMANGSTTVPPQGRMVELRLSRLTGPQQSIRGQTGEILLLRPSRSWMAWGLLQCQQLLRGEWWPS
jgi:putative peptide zinc metalloprotease protein